MIFSFDTLLTMLQHDSIVWARLIAFANMLVLYTSVLIIIYIWAKIWKPHTELILHSCRKREEQEWSSIESINRQLVILFLDRVEFLDRADFLNILSRQTRISRQKERTVSQQIDRLIDKSVFTDWNVMKK